MFAQAALLAESDTRAFLTPEPLFPLTGWWWALVGGIALLLFVFIMFMYLYDSVELPAGTTCTLMAMRILAFLGMLIFLINPGIRTEKKVVKSSRVSILVDTSLSMGLRDQQTSSDTGPSRLEQVALELAEGGLIPQLRAKHEVIVYGFDQLSKPTEIASYEKLDVELASNTAGSTLTSSETESVKASRQIAVGAGVILILAIVLGVMSMSIRSKPDGESLGAWVSFLSLLLMVAATVTLAIADLRTTSVSFWRIVGIAGDEEQADADDEAADEEVESDDSEVDLKAELLPSGTETRIGDAVRYLVNKERGGPVAGLIVFSDGRNNSGSSHRTAAFAANDAHIPIYTVGLGSTETPSNVRVVDLQAPGRVYPGDKFTIKGLIQAYGFTGRRAKLRLVSTQEDDEDQIERFEGEQTRNLLDDGKELSVEFDITPEKKDGRRIYTMKVIPPDNDADAKDNNKSAKVEVVDKKTKVFVIAGGPSREFRFLRNQLYRDDDSESVIWLQSGTPGMAHAEGREELRFDFPEDADELFEFDCILAFDADWRRLSAEQVELLERWVAEKAGGLVVVAGPVYTPRWTLRGREDQRMVTMRALYPVSFFSQGSATIRPGRFGGDEAFPLQFSREGTSAEFLWLEENSEKAKQAWNDFEGVYGYYAVNEPKPAAAVYARFSDESTRGGPNDVLPIYLAGQFYGAGRVFFQASGEMWRIREVDTNYFETYYTKLIRWCSQGRLLRDSTRGVLLVDKDRCILGEHVEVRAILTNAQNFPLIEEQVNAVLIAPNGSRETLTLKRLKDSSREGTFAGQFTALDEGDYHVIVAVPDSEEGELLTREVRVRIPDLEIEQPQRHDELLGEMADLSYGGGYFQSIDSAMNRTGGGKSLVSAIEPQNQTTYLPGTPDPDFSTKLMNWLLMFICGVLSLEWLMRRLSKLA